MRTAFLAALLGVGAQGASELVFKSPAGSGGSATIAFDGTTLTVPQHCRNSVCNDHGSAIAKLDAKIATLDAKLEKALAEIHTKINTTPAPTPAPTPCVKKELASGTTIGETTDQSGRTGYTTPNGWRVSLENGSVYSNGQYYWLSGMFDGSNSCDTTTCATRENRAKLHNCYLYTNGDNGGRMGIRLDLPKETYVDHLMLDPITRTEKDNIVDSFGVKTARRALLACVLAHRPLPCRGRLLTTCQLRLHSRNRSTRTVPSL